jgi:hypothetical protein
VIFELRFALYSHTWQKTPCMRHPARDRRHQKADVCASQRKPTAQDRCRGYKLAFPPRKLYIPSPDDGVVNAAPSSRVTRVLSCPIATQKEKKSRRLKEQVSATLLPWGMLWHLNTQRVRAFPPQHGSGPSLKAIPAAASKPLSARKLVHYLRALSRPPYITSRHSNGCCLALT